MHPLPHYIKNSNRTYEEEKEATRREGCVNRQKWLHIFFSCCWRKELLNRNSNKQRRVCLTHLERKLLKLCFFVFKANSPVQSACFIKCSSVHLQQKLYFFKKDFSLSFRKKFMTLNINSEFLYGRISWKSTDNYSRHTNFWKGFNEM